MVEADIGSRAARPVFAGPPARQGSEAARRVRAQSRYKALVPQWASAEPAR